MFEDIYKDRRGSTRYISFLPAFGRFHFKQTSFNIFSLLNYGLDTRIVVGTNKKIIAYFDLITKTISQTQHYLFRAINTGISNQNSILWMRYMYYMTERNEGISRLYQGFGTIKEFSKFVGKELLFPLVKYNPILQTLEIRTEILPEKLRWITDLNDLKVALGIKEYQDEITVIVESIMRFSNYLYPVDSIDSMEIKYLLKLINKNQEILDDINNPDPDLARDWKRLRFYISIWMNAL